MLIDFDVPWMINEAKGTIESPCGWVCTFETYRDARLIAAAPDLLEACRFAIDIIGCPYHLDSVSTCRACQAENKMLAAIAKAEGREPC